MIKQVLLAASAVWVLVVSQKYSDAYTPAISDFADTLRTPDRFGFGRPATIIEVRRFDIDVRPDGKGLPVGSGTATVGAQIYELKCAGCHGVNGYEGPYDALLIAPDITGNKNKRVPKVIANYWPYATTLFDYIRRAMPYNFPGSLSDEEVYSVTAYLLWKSGLWTEYAPLHAQNLPTIEMPSRARFVPDDRVDGVLVR